MPARLSLPGFVNAHSHAFQRALRGRRRAATSGPGASRRLDLAEGLTPGHVREGYVTTYREMRAAGYTAVGEFHYVGLGEAHAAVEAAHEAGIELVLLLSAYGRGGIDRFRQESVAEYSGRSKSSPARGAARACPALRSRVPARVARGDRRLRRTRGARPGATPTSSRARSRSAWPSTGCGRSSCSRSTGCLGPRTTIVHGTHADERELDLLGEAGARVCLCPTTEANLGDGFPPLEGLLAREIPLCIGSDSNVRIDPLEELRKVEGTPVDSNFAAT